MQAVGRGLLRCCHRKNIGSRINDYAGCDQIPLNVLSRLSIETETHMIMQDVGRGLLRCCHRKNIGSRINNYAGCDQTHVNVLSRLSIETETHMIMQAVGKTVNVFEDMIMQAACVSTGVLRCCVKHTGCGSGQLRCCHRTETNNYAGCG